MKGIVELKLAQATSKNKLRCAPNPQTLEHNKTTML